VSNLCTTYGYEQKQRKGYLLFYGVASSPSLQNHLFSRRPSPLPPLPSECPEFSLSLAGLGRG
jgi:hypothetical protein